MSSRLKRLMHNVKQFVGLTSTHFVVPKRGIDKMPQHSITIHDMYDNHTLLIMRIALRSDSSCIDVGAHTGSILSEIVKLCPNGKHFAFEPIPHLFKSLQDNFPNVKSYDCALSDEEGMSTFYYLENAPGYSGLRKRRYDRPDPKISEITVKKNCLDNIIPPRQLIHFIKIDVEGGELSVLRGAKRLISENKPLIIFESGLGASDYYGTTGEMLFDFLVGECGMEINTLNGFLCGKPGLTRDALVHEFNTVSHYYFVASRPLCDHERLSNLYDYLLDLDMRVFNLEHKTSFACSKDCVDFKVGTWGPHSMTVGDIPNKQPNGYLGIWIQVTSEQGIGEVKVLFDGQPFNGYVSEKLITTGIPPSQLVQPGKKEIVIKQVSTGKTFPVGTFVISPERRRQS
jgi:FkbM family methyltransferase